MGLAGWIGTWVLLALAVGPPLGMILKRSSAPPAIIDDRPPPDLRS